jgi:hypothetical protein
MPKMPTPHEQEVAQILSEGRAERTRQAIERRQRDAEAFAQLEAGERAQRQQEEAARAWPRSHLDDRLQ